jgi:hypothetical protein
MLQFTCSACGHRLQGDISLATKSVLCPVCNSVIDVPSVHGDCNPATAFAMPEDARKAKVITGPVPSDNSFQGGLPPIDPGSRQLDESNGHVRRIFRHVSIVVGLGVAAIGVAWLFASGALLSDAVEFNWPEQPDETTGVALVIRPQTQTIKAGEWPKFTFALENRGKNEVLLVAPSDGSGDAMRTPSYQWSRRPRETFGRDCGRINPLTLDDIFRIAPGKTHELSGWIHGPYRSGPGRYRVSLRFVNDPKKEFTGLCCREPGYHDPDAMAMVRRSTPIVVVSNQVEIIVTR